MKNIKLDRNLLYQYVNNENTGYNFNQRRRKEINIDNPNFPTDKPSRYLYAAGGWTSVLFLIYSFVTILIFVLIEKGYPETAAECFNMLKEDRFTALLRLDIVSVIVIPFYYLLFFSIYQSLKKGHELIAKIALFCTLSGITIFIAGLNIASIINLSDKYHMTTSPEMKQQLLSACEGMLASDMWINTGAIIRGILIETGAIVFSVLMLKTAIFIKRRDGSDCLHTDLIY